MSAQSSSLASHHELLYRDASQTCKLTNDKPRDLRRQKEGEKMGRDWLGGKGEEERGGRGERREEAVAGGEEEGAEGGGEEGDGRGEEGEGGRGRGKVAVHRVGGISLVVVGLYHSAFVELGGMAETVGTVRVKTTTSPLHHLSPPPPVHLPFSSPFTLAASSSPSLPCCLTGHLSLHLSSYHMLLRW